MWTISLVEHHTELAQALFPLIVTTAIALFLVSTFVLCSVGSTLPSHGFYEYGTPITCLVKFKVLREARGLPRALWYLPLQPHFLHRPHCWPLFLLH